MPDPLPFERQPRPWGMILGVLILLALVGHTLWLGAQPDSNVPEKAYRTSIANLGLGQPVTNRLHPRFTDADGDLLADPPTDPADLTDPATLTFSYIPGRDPGHYQQVFAPLVEHLSRSLGRPVVYVTYPSVNAQLKALKAGSLHVVGLSTGSVPIAVNDAGFIPVCGTARPDGRRGYRTAFITRANSGFNSLDDLRGQTIALTHINSNSGCKAPLLILHDRGMLPERDYLWAFTRSHRASIRAVLEGTYPAAAVASDLLERSPFDTRALQIIHVSPPFPPAAIGHHHSLKPATATKLRDALLSFDMTGNSVGEEYHQSGYTQYVELNYKDDWPLVRRIDNALGRKHVIE